MLLKRSVNRSAASTPDSHPTTNGPFPSFSKGPSKLGAFLTSSICLPLLLLGLSNAAGSASPRAHAQARASIKLKQPAGLALSPGGDLYIADRALNEIIERQADGNLRVVAGTGKAGFSGDGKLATDARLKQPTALVRAANGDLFVADTGNFRVRELLLDGRITTIAGDGLSGGVKPPKAGKIATKVAINPSALTIGPNRDLYVADGNVILELAKSGTIADVINLATTPGIKVRYRLCGPEALAFDRSGDLIIGCGNASELIERSPSGHFSVVLSSYRPHDYAGLVAAPGGVVIFADGESLIKVVNGKTEVVSGLDAFAKPKTFVPSGVAIAANGTIYTDSQWGDGFTDGSALATVAPSGHVTLLDFWRW